MNPKSESLINQIFFEKFKIIKKIGQGSFGRIYSCQDITTNEFFAMKVEQNSFQNNVLETESKYLTYLKGFGIPEIKYFGHTDKYHLLIETLLDKSLENLYSESHGNFNLKDVSMIGIQVLDRLEYIHNKNVIHRDIKPDNFVIGKNVDKKTIYIIDFGLAKKYRNPKTLEHIQFKMTKRLTGTARYASVNALKGGEQSRKDDLESLVYMLLYFLRGGLPWQGVAGMTTGEKYKKIYYLKKNIGAEKLFENLPEEFKEFYLYVKKLEFEQEPDYNYCRKLFLNIIEKRLGESNDNFFTWCKEINIINKNYFTGTNLFNKFNNNDESGKTLKSSKIMNACNSNILLEKINIKKIKKISVTFIDKKKKNKNKIMNCAYNAYNYSLEKKRNKSLLLDNICDINKNSDDSYLEKNKKNKEIIVTNSSKSKNSNDDYSIEGEVEKNKNKNNKKNIIKNKDKNKSKDASSSKNKINILSLTKINKKKNFRISKINKFNKNMNRTRTNRDLLNFAEKNFNFILNNQLSQRNTRNRFSKNKSRESKSKSGNKIKQKNTTYISHFLYQNIFNNSPGKIKKTRNKIISIYKTNTNTKNKKKAKIKHSIQNKNKNNEEKSNKKISILLEDFIGNKNTKINNKIKKKCTTSKTNNIKNYLKNMYTYKHRYSNLSNISSNPKKDRYIHSKDKYYNSNNDLDIRSMENNSKNKKRSKSSKKSRNKSKSKSRSKSRSKSKNRKDIKKISSLSKKNSKHHSISNKQLKVQKIFSGNGSKRDIIININKYCLKRKKSNNFQKSDTYLNRIFNKKNNIKSNNLESRNNTINIESIVFVGDNNNINQYSLKKFKNKNNPKNNNIIYTPENENSQNKKTEKNNFLKKFKISILCSNKKNHTNNNSIKYANISKKKKIIGEKNHNYNNISLKLSDNKFKIKNKKNNKNIIYNYNNKKIGPLSFNNLITNIRAKKNININNNIFCNNSLIEKKYFIQNSFNSSDSNYILNNINNNNIIVNNFNNSNNNSTSQISKKMINSYTINHPNIFPDEINENGSNNFEGLFNNSNSIFKGFIVRSNKNANKKECNSRQNIMKFITKFHKNNVIKDNIQKVKNKK